MGAFAAMALAAVGSARTSDDRLPTGLLTIRQLDVGSRIASVTSAKSASDKGKALTSLFDHMSRSEMEELTIHPDTTIALTAGWRLTCSRAVPFRHRFPAADVTHPGYSALDPLAAQWFFGFLQGRIRSPISEFWKYELDNSIADVDLPFGFDVEKAADYFRMVKVSKTLSVLVPRDTNVRQEGGLLVVARLQQWGKVQLTNAQDETLPTIDGQAILRISAAFSGENVYYVKYPQPVGRAYELFSADANTGRTKWQAMVWGNVAEDRLPGGADGFHYHFVAMEASTAAVCVFGVGSQGMYIEGFDPESGRNQFRFCTSHWLH
jgi:hypothetical protein